MKRNVITCDICGKDITSHDIRYKGKIKEYDSNYVNFDDFEFAKWKRLDVCNTCMFEFAKFIKKSENNGE